MIQNVSHLTLYVLDQVRAKQFYTEKLGFEVRADQTMGNFRWLTVAPKGQPGPEIVLMSVDTAPKLDDAQRAALRKLVESGVLGSAVFQTADCRKTYAELKERGVHFNSEPKDQFYGVEAMFQDDSGNWFSLTQRK